MRYAGNRGRGCGRARRARAAAADGHGLASRGTWKCDGYQARIEQGTQAETQGGEEEDPGVDGCRWLISELSSVSFELFGSGCALLLAMERAITAGLSWLCVAL